MIEHSGPISLARYMALCLSDPDFGYYTQGEPIGAPKSARCSAS